MPTQEAVATSPSDRARALAKGAYDLHVHVAPDVSRRRIDDRTLARRFTELGLAGFALKSHYTSTPSAHRSSRRSSGTSRSSAR